MPAEVKLMVMLDEDKMWSVRLPRGGYIAKDKSLPTCLRKAATKLAKLKA